MAKRKLTPKIKEHLYENRFKVKLSDYDGEALAYLKRLRAASKAAKTRKQSTAKIGDTIIPRNSELYEIIEQSANAKGLPVSTFIKKNKQAIQELLRDGKVPIQRETSYAISDISKLPKRSKIYINGEKVSKADAIYAIQNFTSTSMQYTSTVVVNYEMSYDLTGNLYLELPMPDDYESTVEEMEEMDEEEASEQWLDYIAQFDTIIGISSPKKSK